MTDETSDPFCPPPERVELEKIRLAVKIAFCDETLAGATPEIQSYRDHAMKMQVVELVSTILGQRQQWCDYACPATWWDHVKERFFPRWLRRRFPIQYREEIVEATALLPSLNIAIPGHRTTILVQRIPKGVRASVEKIPWRTQHRPPAS